MDIVPIMFTFHRGQVVRWWGATGSRYRIRQRRYVEDDDGNEKYQYLLHSASAQGYDFWANEEALVTVEEDPW